MLYGEVVAIVVGEVVGWRDYRELFFFLCKVNYYILAIILESEIKASFRMIVIMIFHQWFVGFYFLGYALLIFSLILFFSL